MILYYRLCAKDRQEKRPAWYTGKSGCYHNFQTERVRAGLPEPVIVCDGELPEWKLPDSVIKLDNYGGGKSFWYVYSQAVTLPQDEWVYFAEDDYWYKPHAFTKLLGAIHTMPIPVDFITLYDHPDRYRDLPEHNLTHGKDTIYVAGYHHWRTVPSTTMTFAARVSALQAGYDLFNEWTNREGCTVSWELFPRLQGLKDNTGLSMRLVGALPSLATHCETEHLAPLWKEI